MVLHDRANRDDYGFWSSDAGTGKIWRMKIVEPSSDFVRGGISEKKADLTLDVLPITVNV